MHQEDGVPALLRIQILQESVETMFVLVVKWMIHNGMKMDFRLIFGELPMVVHKVICFLFLSKLLY